MTKTEYAFRRSAELLFEESSKVFFWTFTFKRVMPDWYYARCWSRFIRDVGTNVYGGTLHGLKVVELHETHGIHFHCLLNRRVWVGEVRRVAARYGIGRVHVMPADEGSIGYLAKYLGKQFRAEKLFSGAARWGTVGGFRGCRVRDVVCESEFHRTVAFCQAQLRLEKLPFLFTRALFRKRYPYNEALLARACRLWQVTGSLAGFVGKGCDEG